MTEELLDWTRHLSWPEATALSLLANVVVFFGALGIGHVAVRAFGSRPVASSPPPITRVELALASACVVLNAAVMLGGWGLFRAGIVRVDGDGFGWRWLLDAVALLVVMDLAMYVTHRIAHLPILFDHVHSIHHRYDRPRPLTLFVLHPVEVVGFGSLWIAVLCLHAFSLGGMLLYLTANTLSGVLGHVGVEPLPRRWVDWPVARFLGTSTFHARHHQRRDSNFGFYSTVWDRLFGTLDTTYQSTFARKPEPP